MHTINDVLNFHNKMEVECLLSGSEYDNFNNMRIVLIDEFSHMIDMDKLEEILRCFDNLYLEHLRKKCILISR